ncbi:MAG: hypothetical protein ACYDCQ_16725 [Dehalococcoidia bacterium]
MKIATLTVDGKRDSGSAFMRGVARIFDFGGAIHAPVVPPLPRSESEELAAVWKAVGHDLSHAIAAYEHKHQVQR